MSSSSTARPPPLRPATYYDADQPFSAPSSPSEDGHHELDGGDDEDDTLLGHEKVPPSPGFAERGGLSRPTPPSRFVSLRFLAITIGSLLGLSVVIGFFAASTYGGTLYRAPGSERITMDHVFNGTFSADRGGIEWVKEAGDGVFSRLEGGKIKLVDLKSNTTRELLSTMDIKDVSHFVLETFPKLISRRTTATLYG